ncbi:MAG TPA: hypothetical protein VGI85_11705 [Chthoniobacterales bacterium]|jgi:hypothetical protein
MKTIELKLPEMGLFALTRVALGVGVGLLASMKLDDKQRRAVGVTLLLVGILTTVPFAVHVFGEEN